MIDKDIRKPNPVDPLLLQEYDELLDEYERTVDFLREQQEYIGCGDAAREASLSAQFDGLCAQMDSINEQLDDLEMLGVPRSEERATNV